MISDSTSPSQTIPTLAGDNVKVIKVYSGDCFVTTEKNTMLTTILGSCISVCARDPFLGIGGMNHFLLPEVGHQTTTASSRYGAYAMEELINSILSKGGKKASLELKAFGGGSIMQTQSDIGKRNCQFLMEYIQREGLIIQKKDLGGQFPRRLHYYPDSGKVLMRKVTVDNECKAVQAEENQLSRSIYEKVYRKREDDVELF